VIAVLLSGLVRADCRRLSGRRSTLESLSATTLVGWGKEGGGGPLSCRKEAKAGFLNRLGGTVTRSYLLRGELLGEGGDKYWVSI